VPTGIDLTRFRFRERRPPAQGPLRVLTVGRLVEKKGVRYALEATAKLVCQGRDLEHVIIGDGPLRAELEALSASLGLSGRVSFMGVRAHATIVDELARAHLFLAPSITSATGNEEGVPNTLKEAMACGVPVVSTRHAGIPELVEDGASGLLAPERDSDALAERIAFLIDHPEAWDGMGRRGRATVEATYAAPVAHARLHTIYRSAIERFPGPCATRRSA
jgi:colanic acid/amylovoran biosynthesis glycosyltransferase